MYYVIYTDKKGHLFAEYCHEKKEIYEFIKSLSDDYAIIDITKSI